MRIRGGYYLKAKCIMESKIMRQPPHVREVWDWLLGNVSFEDEKTVKRGQIHTSTAELREALHWMVGYRKEQYTKDAMKFAMKTLRKLDAVTTTKTQSGMLITVCKYDTYQNPKNYESTTEAPPKPTTKAPAESPPKAPPINSIKEEGKRKKEELFNLEITLENISLKNIEAWLAKKKFSFDVEEEFEKFKIHYRKTGGKMSGGRPIKDWVAALQSWFNNAHKFEVRNETNRGTNRGNNHPARGDLRFKDERGINDSKAAQLRRFREEGFRAGDSKIIDSDGVPGNSGEGSGNA